ncbi:hypothetical protein FAZ19_00085 [Sphingobacterium alkalisoli]|uniref:Uncharacterized protein n=1 Tax=Sphingobacterium alkalisoli TaxID=1874115 RepID=A0A4U0H7E9_9SPHI|nr:hypothetical protein [Sphingobacterium alkalisoli]TJY67700.1 hypothetical protein FAZ19_00085 [Sphingobacterium alkalisoli]GGH11899.1 hypothetical protein GCM10011418_11100 [Sphingobacterium alkalisoli]
MRKLRKGESYGLQSQQVASRDNIYKEKISPAQKIYIDDARIVKYGQFLSIMAKEFRITEFADYQPSKIIDSFWSKHSWDNTEQFNLFDLILLAQGAVAEKSNEAKALNSFLKDFLSYMMASHTVHYINRTDSAIGRSLSAEQVGDIKEGVRLDFVSRLSGLR